MQEARRGAQREKRRATHQVVDLRLQTSAKTRGPRDRFAASRGRLGQTRTAKRHHHPCHSSCLDSSRPSTGSTDGKPLPANARRRKDCALRLSSRRASRIALPAEPRSHSQFTGSRHDVQLAFCKQRALLRSSTRVRKESVYMQLPWKRSSYELFFSVCSTAQVYLSPRTLWYLEILVLSLQ